MQTEISKDNDKQIVLGSKRENFVVNNSKHVLEQRPRSTGFKSFLNWFKKVENSQRNVEEETSSLSESSGDDSSASSTATVASFAFLPANIYKPYGDACQPEKFIASGPYTETYHRLIGERNRRRNLDKNLSLRKKYSLYSSGTLGGKVDTILLPHQKVVHAENVNYVQVYDTFSLPAVARKGDYEILFNDNRKTASLSAKDAKAINCHVKGKRKAPQPPANNMDFTKTYRKKRQAPAPPEPIFYSSHSTATNIILPQAEDKMQNQSKNKITPLNMEKTKNSFIAQSELSPKPWYKRQNIETKPKNKNVKNSSTKKKNKHEYPEVGFFRCSRIFENKKQVPGDNPDLEIKQEKRASFLLPNISQLDREAVEIIKHHKKDLESRPENSKENLIKPSSARDLINKFNALTNVTDVHPAIDDGKAKSPLGLLARKQHIDNVLVLPEKSEKSELFLNNTKSIIDNAKEQNKRYCSICGLENITSGNKCIHCINVQLQSTSVTGVKEEFETKKNSVNFEASQSFQAEVFSAIENFNFTENKVSSPLPVLKITEIRENDLNNSPKLTDSEEKYRLRELLKEMKNSLPKRPKPTKLPVTDSASIANGEIRKESIIFPSPTGLHSVTNDVPNIKNNKGNLLDLLSKIKPESIPVIPVQTSNNIITTKEDRSDSKEKGCLNKPIIVNSKIKKITEENNTNAPKDSVSNKVSSSAQTNCMVKKSDQFLANKQSKDVLGKDTKQEEIANIKKCADLENKKKDEAINILSNALYINIQESRNAFPKPKLADQLNNNNGNTKLLLKKLETAIAQGDDLLAAKLAKDLALLKVNCSVTSTATIHAKEINIKSIQIYIEDQFSHQGPITIRVKEDLTIADLKIRVFEELQIPAGVQRWIIGKQLTTNDYQTLAHFNGNDFNIPLFLYVVAPEVQPEKDNKNLSKPIEIAKATVPLKNEITKPVEKTAESTRNPSHVNIDQRRATKKVTPIAKVEQASQGPSKVKIKTETPALKDVIKKTWICSACTLINSLLSPLCSACGARKALVSANKAEEKIEIKPLETKEHYQQLVNLDNADLVLNIEQFECPVCLMECKPGAGVTLRECLHSFCKECLANTVKFCEEAEIKCPYRDKEYFCDSAIQEREIKALVNKTMYEQHLAKSVNFAENKIKNAFHCKSPDCKGWCIFEENVNDFKCPVCKKTNCLTCQAIHEGKNCKEYQDHEQEQASSSSEANGRATKQMLDEMVSRGEAMLCPSCQVVLMKKWGCDWLRCSMCKTEICWVTRGPRWGPGGKGDTSTGCQCGLNGVKCHPKCNYCH